MDTITYEHAPIHGATVPTPPAWAEPLIGTSIVSSFEIVPAASCTGYVDGLSEKYADDKGYRFEGWAWDRAAGRPFDQVVSVDSYLTITGAGQQTVLRPDVQAALPQLVDNPNVGYQLIAFGDYSSSMVFGLNLKSRQACPVAPLKDQ